MSRAPIDDIPLETLVTVFREITREPVVLMQLAMVCRNWRDIVLATGELWNHIIIKYDTRMAQLDGFYAKTEVQLRRQLELSGEALLVLDLEGHPRVAPLSRLVLEWNQPRPIMGRICSLTAQVPHREDSNNSLCQLLSEGYTWPQLRTLRLSSQRGRLRAHLRAPNLEIIKLEEVDFNEWDYVGLGSAFYDATWRGPGEEAVPFLRAVARCPNLQRLDIVTQGDKYLEFIHEMRPEPPLWPKLVDLSLQCWKSVSGADILAILSHAPNLTMLKLVWDTLVQSVRRVPSPYRSSFSLRRLMMDPRQRPKDSNAELLGLALLQGIFDRYNPAALEVISISRLQIPLGIPASCTRLQQMALNYVVLPHNFIEGLSQLPSIKYIGISESKVQNIQFSIDDEGAATGSPTFTGTTFTGGYTGLRKLFLFHIVVHLEFVTQLSHCPHLDDLSLQVLSVESDPGSAEDNWPDINTMTPLPKLRRLSVSFVPTNYRQTGIHLLTPAAQYVVLAAAHLVLDMASSKINLVLAPLQAADVARYLFPPGRIFLDLEILFQMDENSPTVIMINFLGCVAAAGEHKPFEWTVAVRMIELTDIADMILNQFPLDSDIKAIDFDKKASSAVRMASEQTPDNAGLQHILRRAAATVGLLTNDRTDPLF